ncbi:MAG: S46 family peptidase [Catalinimonas sp.]
MRRLLLCLLLLAPAARADEGLWLPNLLNELLMNRMQAQGLRLTAEDIYAVNRSSLKDAVAQFGSGCTGEVISPEGLLLTNHHCGYGRILSHSTVEQDYLTDGFWAASRADELPNPGLTVTFIVRIEEVTARVLAEVKPNMGEGEREKAIEGASKALAQAARRGTHYGAFVRPFYAGNEFYLFVTEEFQDVRLVGAPPSAVGKYGGETDNWVWPRHTGDFSLFRIYAGPDNRPAPYSPDNRPYRPRYHLPVSLRGVQPGDFTMVMGFPGRTQQYLTSWAVEQLVRDLNPPKVRLRGERLRIMAEGMAANDTVRLAYAGRHAGVANYWKKWHGETEGLLANRAVARKRDQEAEFTEWVAADSGRQARYGNLLPTFREAYASMEGVALGLEYFREAVLASQLLSYANQFEAYAVDARPPDSKEDKKAAKERREAAEEKIKELTERHFGHFDATIERRTLAAVLRAYHHDLPPHLQPLELRTLVEKHERDFEAAAAAVFQESRLASPEGVARLLKRPYKKQLLLLRNDPAYQLARGFVRTYRERILPIYLQANERLVPASRHYVAGLREMYADSLLFPDANLTLRLSYGQVRGYAPRDGIYYQHQTTLAGAVAKQDSTTDDFRVPDRLDSLFLAKDYGRYGAGDTLPVAFIATNHTTGGNSGSPVLNADGHLVGLNFDRVWEGTMSDVLFDPARCRNISVDVRYVLFLIDKFAGAGHLVEEMTLVE